MPVFKNKTQGQYVNVYKDILKNHSLSLRDRGMVVTLLSLPDNIQRKYRSPSKKQQI